MRLFYFMLSCLKMHFKPWYVACELTITFDVSLPCCLRAKCDLWLIMCSRNLSDLFWSDGELRQSQLSSNSVKRVELANLVGISRFCHFLLNWVELLSWVGISRNRYFLLNWVEKSIKIYRFIRYVHYFSILLSSIIKNRNPHLFRVEFSEDPEFNVQICSKDSEFWLGIYQLI